MPQIKSPHPLTVGAAFRNPSAPLTSTACRRHITEIRRHDNFLAKTDTALHPHDYIYYRTLATTAACTAKAFARWLDKTGAHPEPQEPSP